MLRFSKMTTAPFACLLYHTKRPFATVCRQNPSIDKFGVIDIILLMKAKACIFDFDGVIVDSEKYHHIAWEQIAIDLGVPFSYQEYAPLKSAGRQVVIPYLFKKANKQLTPQLFEYYVKLRGEKIAEAIKQVSEKDIIPGVVQFVHLLKQNGIPCAVASASTQASETAKRFGLYNLFDAFVDGNARLPHKPAPDIFLHAASLLNANPTTCVVFEDSIYGLMAAQNAQMRIVGVATHFSDIADKIIDDFVGADLTLLEFED